MCRKDNAFAHIFLAELRPTSPCPHLCYSYLCSYKYKHLCVSSFLFRKLPEDKVPRNHYMMMLIKDNKNTKKNSLKTFCVLFSDDYYHCARGLMVSWRITQLITSISS